MKTLTAFAALALLGAAAPAGAQKTQILGQRLFPPNPTTNCRGYDAETTAYLKRLNELIETRRIGVVIFHYALWAENRVAREYYLGWTGGLWVRIGPKNPVRSTMGMIVTSTGIVFSTARDGVFHAFDAETGEVLRQYKLPMSAEGLPAIYEVKGKHYLVVNATTPQTLGLNSRESGIGSSEPLGWGGYGMFALPD